MRTPALALWAAALLAVACGTDDDDTAGPDVRAFRQRLEPIILEVSAVEAEVTERAVGSSGAATAAHLEAAYRDLRPRLLEALVALDRLQPPAQVADIQDSIRRLILLRLDAYRLVIEGYAAGDSTAYEEAEAKLAAANALIAAVNARLCEVDVALGDRDDCSVLG